MSFLQVLILAILQGITEFLPISSEGHLVIMENLLQMNTEKSMLLTVMLHIGTLLSILIVFRKDLIQLMLELRNITADIVQNGNILLHNRRHNDAKRYIKVLSNNNRKFVIMIFVSMIPTAIIGLMLKPIVTNAEGSLLSTGIGLLITAVFLMVVNFTKQGDKRPLDMDYRIALLIGAVQGFAVLPGVSRTGVTLAICLLCGFTCKFTIKYSFILNIPTIIGAAIVVLTSAPVKSFSGVEILYCIAGVVIAAIVGLACVKAALTIIKKKRLIYFAGYSLIIGIIAMTYHFA